MRRPLLEIADAVDRWETARCDILRRCENATTIMAKRIDVSIDAFPAQHLFLEDSPERVGLEAQLQEAIVELEGELLVALAEREAWERLDDAQNRASVMSAPPAVVGPVTDFAGWSFSDIGGLLAGSSAAGSIAAVGGRAAPGALAAVGLGVAAAPVAVLAGIAGLALSARGLTVRKRDAYRRALKEGVARLVLREETHPSVLSSHFDYIDKLYAPLMEP